MSISFQELLILQALGDKDNFPYTKEEIKDAFVEHMIKSLGLYGPEGDELEILSLEEQQ